jgi:hypothetical protein
VSILAREKRTAILLAEVGATVAYGYDPASSFKWSAKVTHPSIQGGYPRGTKTEIAATTWGLNLEVRRIARRIAKVQASQFRADQMTKAAVR